MSFDSLAPTFGTPLMSLRGFMLSSHYDHGVAITVVCVRLHEGLQQPSSCSLFRVPGGHSSCPSYNPPHWQNLRKRGRGGAGMMHTEDGAHRSRVGGMCQVSESAERLTWHQEAGRASEQDSGRSKSGQQGVVEHPRGAPQACGTQSSDSSR